MSKDKIAYIIISLISLIAIQLCYGIKVLYPSNISWLMSVYGDWGTHYLGWAFYRNDQWTFPVGEITSYYHPIGTNIGFTDSIPLLAIFFKIFDAVLPEDFQYFGLWLYSCHFLIGFYMYKILKYYNVKPIAMLFGVIIVVFSPVLLYRGLHPALCAQWLLLASYYNFCRKATPDNVMGYNKNQLVIIMLSATITPYLTAMVIGFSIIIPLKNYFIDKALSIKKLILIPFFSVLSVLCIWFVIGLLGNSETNLATVSTYGQYALNLNFFINSFGRFSKFLPDLGLISTAQEEGFAYLGIGGILMLITATVYFILGLINKRCIALNLKYYYLLVLMCGLFVIFAVSGTVTCGKTVLFTIKVPAFIQNTGDVFRAVGRFVWPFYYLVLIFSFIVIVKMRVNLNVKVLFLFLMVSLQLYDISSLIASRNLKYGAYHTKLQDEKWIPLIKTFNGIVTYPPFSSDFAYEMDYQDIAFLAYKSKTTVTNGYVAREKITLAQKYSDTVTAMLMRGEVYSNKLYITSIDNLENFKVAISKDKVTVIKMDSLVAVFSKGIKLPEIIHNTVNVSWADSITNFYERNTFYKSEIQLKDSQTVLANIDKYMYSNDVLNLRGWAIDRATTNPGDSIFIGLKGKKEIFITPTKLMERPDIVVAHNVKNINTGFSLISMTNKIPQDKYQIIIIVKTKGGLTAKYTDKFISTIQK